MIRSKAPILMRIKGLCHQFNAQTLLPFDDWEISKGQHWLLHGKSGTGKTTLLHIISGLLKPWEGSVELDGSHLYDLPSNELDRFRGKHIGIVFQRPHLIRNLSLAENLLIAQYLAGRKQDKGHVAYLINFLGLTGKARSYPSQLSQGQMQRASIARAVINSPAIIIADEPTSSLDNENALLVIDLLKQAAAENEAAMIIATHDERLKPYFSNTYTLNNTL